MEQAMAYSCQQTVPPSPATLERPDPPGKSAPPVRQSRRRRLGGAAYYALAGLASVAVLPATSITAAVFLVTGAAVPALGLLAALASLSVLMGGYTAPPLLAYPVTVAAGLLLLLAGRGLWRFTVGFVRLLFVKKKKLRK